MSNEFLEALKQNAATTELVKVELPAMPALWFPKDMTLHQQKLCSEGVKKDDEEALALSYVLHMARTETGAPAFEANASTRAALENSMTVRQIQKIMTTVGAPETVDQAKNG